MLNLLRSVINVLLMNRIRTEEEKKKNREHMRLFRQTEKGKQIRREESRLYRMRHLDRILERNRKWYAKNKEKARAYRKGYAKKRWLEIITSKGGKCEICGFSNTLALELHHINGKEKGEKSQKKLISSYPKDELQLVCANCHKIIHRTTQPINYLGTRNVS